MFRRSGASVQTPTPVEPQVPAGPGKNRRTPTRREAEAARRARAVRTLSKSEARREAARRSRAARMQALTARESTPEKVLLRDYVDARFSVGELLLPSLAVILLSTLFSGIYPAASLIGTIAMYVFILLVALDIWVMWRGFKRVLAERLPKAPLRGLLMYGMNRCIQIRRFRMPPPRIKRGEAY